MVRFEVLILASVGRFLVNWMEGLKLLRWLRKLCNCSGPRGQTTNVSSTYWSYRDGLYCAESRASFSKCSMKILLTIETIFITCQNIQDRRTVFLMYP
jgi:hypothetical protein